MADSLQFSMAHLGLRLLQDYGHRGNGKRRIATAFSLAPSGLRSGKPQLLPCQRHPYVARKKAYLIVRLNPDGILLEAPGGSEFGLLEALQSIRTAGQMGEWEVWVPFEDHAPVSARLCVVCKSQTAIALVHKKLRRYASKHGAQLQPQTLLYAQYVMVLTTFPRQEFSLQQVLERYRFRWQVELVFKRFKQIAQLGHLPKYAEDSAKAWLYGKLFVPLLTEKLIRHGDFFSPWGFPFSQQTPSQPVA